MATYVALLRGINVGGNNIIKMTALKACFEAQGFTDVATYIQSGNVVFGAAAREAVVAQAVEDHVAADLRAHHGTQLEHHDGAAAHDGALEPMRVS
jgi:uncharacterized protein (DUF1697 family)